MADRASLPAGALRLSESAARQLDVCVHCGFCLPVCPTFAVLGQEPDSPRGRIDLIRAAAEGEVSVADPDLRLHLERCLDCRACESACPSGVRYGELYEGAVASLASSAPLRAPAALRVGLHAVGHPGLLRWAARMGRRRGRLVRRLTGSLDALLPAGEQPSARETLPAVLPACGTKRAEVDLFVGCVQDAVLGRDNLAMAAVLSLLGVEVHFERRQTCCGALHLHLGETDQAARLAEQNIAAFAGTERPVVVHGAGCGTVLKDYGRFFAEQSFAAAASSLAQRVKDFSELVGPLVARDALPWKNDAPPLRVTYHDPCHLAHAQSIREQPRHVLRSIPGVEYVELPDADTCCGSAGVYNITQPELSEAILERKVANILETGAEVVVTSNPGCALQLRKGLDQAVRTVRVLSLAELLSQRVRSPEGATSGA